MGTVLNRYKVSVTQDKYVLDRLHNMVSEVNNTVLCALKYVNSIDFMISVLTTKSKNS